MVFDGAFREPYNLEEYGTGSRKKKKDRVIYSKFPYAEIHTLIGKMKLTKKEKIIDKVNICRQAEHNSRFRLSICHYRET